MDKTNPIIKEALWTRNYVSMILLSLFIGISLNMTGTLTPLFARELGSSLSTVGIIVAAFTVTALIFRPFFGNIVDTKGRKVTIIIGGVLFTLATLSYGISFSVFGLMFVRLFHGFSFSAHSTAAGTVVADIVPPSRLSEGVGFFGISHTLGMALGPLIGLNLLDYAGFTPVFILSALLGGISVLISFSVKFNNENTKLSATNNSKVINDVTKTNRGFSTSSIIEPSALPSSFVLLFIALTLGAIFTFLPVFAFSRGIEDIGIFFTVFALVQLVARPLTGKLADRFGFTPIIIPGLIFMLIAMILLAYANNIGLFIAAAAAYGIGFGSVQPTLNAIMIKLCPVHRRGVGNATFFSAMDIGIGVGAVLWGVVSELVGFTFVFLGSAFCIILSILVYLFWLSKQLNLQS